MDVVFATKEVRSRTAKADVLALLLLKRVARYLVGHREITISYPYQSNPSQISTATQMPTGPATRQPDSQRQLEHLCTGFTGLRDGQ